MLGLTSWLTIPALLVAGMILYGYLRGRDFRFLFLPLICLFLGAGWTQIQQNNWEKRDQQTKELEDQELEILGRITSIEESDGILKLSMKDNRLWKAADKGKKAQKGIQIHGLLVTIQDYKQKEKEGEAPSMKALGVGETIFLRGTGKRFTKPRNPGEFDSKKFYQAMNLDMKIYGQEFSIVNSQKDVVPEGIRRAKLWIIGTFYRLTGEKEAGIFVASVIGDKEGVAKEIKDLYQKNGIAHLLAISGMHMSVIGLFFYRIFRRAGLGYGLAGVLSSVVVVFYGLLTGNSPSVARAVIMMILGFYASYLGRTYDLLSSASFAIILLSFQSPFILMQGGVQLSFGAVFAIGGVMPVIADWVGTEKLFARTISTSIAIQMVTLPVILYHFYQLPLYGIFLNFLAIPLMDGVVYSGLAVIFFGSFCPVLGTYAAGIGNYILTFYEFACKWFARLPFYNLTFGRPGPERLIGYGSFVLAVLFLLYLAYTMRRRKEKQKKDQNEEEQEPISSCLRRLFLLFIVYGCCMLFFIPAPIRGLEVLFLDVGQGDGILVRIKTSVILVDGGSSSKKSLGEYTLEPCLKSLGVSVITYAFISHGDLDHLSGVRYLLEESEDVKIETVMLPYQGKEDKEIKNLDMLARKRGTRVVYLKEGDGVSVEGLKIACLYPGTDDVADTVNGQSEVLQMDYGNCHMLFTGDMGEKEEERLLERVGEKGLSIINVLKTAHHGSKNSSSEPFLQVVSPRWAVISYGERNTYGHPHREVLERLEDLNAEVFKTGESGAIRLWTDGKRVHFSTYIDGDGFHGYNKRRKKGEETYHADVK